MNDNAYLLARLLPESSESVQPTLPPQSPRFDDTNCWVCGAAVLDVHCKIVCKNCGFTRDCSDP